MNAGQVSSARVLSIRTSWVRLPAVVLVAAAVAGVAVALSHGAAAATPPGCGGAVPKLTVQGQGTASGTPRTLDFDADIQANGSSAQSALSQDNSLTAAVVAALEAHGVASKDIETTNLNVSPNYEEIHGQSVLSGYGVDNSISVTIEHLGAAGSVIDAATAAGGDALSIDSLQFAMSDPRVLQDTARHDAVAQAVGHAGAMAAAAGEHLGPVCALTDDSSPSPTPLRLSAEGFAADSAASVPLEPGTEQATAQITLVYALEARSTR
jgi:uncharacterized protein